MKKKLFFLFVSLFCLIIFLNYSNIVINTLVIFQNNYESSIELYHEDIEPKDRLEEISRIALDSIIKEDRSIKDIKYISIETEKLDLNKNEKAKLREYFKKYNKRVVSLSMSDLKRVGLFNYFDWDISGGVLISIDEVKVRTNEKVIIKVSTFKAGLGGSGYLCTLEFINGEWKLVSKDFLWIA